VVNVTSVSGIIGDGGADQLQRVEGGVIGFTKALAREWRDSAYG